MTSEIPGENPAKKLLQIDLAPANDQVPFTSSLNEAMRSTVKQARLYGHKWIGTEHILLGLVHAEDSVAKQFLNESGVSEDRVDSLMKIVFRVEGDTEQYQGKEMPLTPRARKILELAVQEAYHRDHAVPYIGTQDLLLGIIREGEGIAAGALESFGLDLPRVRYGTQRLAAQTIIHAA